ncbi:MAG: hypothetical protein OD815_000087 [Candidatus Alkanophagales archaeon MCA70_species_2]|nr:hypothetical protein [Candidatus Alkanophaga liquidiphilum]
MGEVKPVCLFPCSGFNIPGQAARVASAIVSERELPDVCEALGIVELTVAFIGGKAAAFEKKLRKQKVITVDGCPYQCAKNLLQRFVRVEPARELIVGLSEDRLEESSKLTHTTDEDVRRVVDAIKKCVEELMQF